MFEKDLLKNKTVIVTGGGTGLGKSMAKQFGLLGAKLSICGRRKEVIDAAVQELKETEAEVLGVQCDVRSGEDVQRMINETVSTLGPVNVLLNNAAGNFISPTERLSENAFRTIVDIVLTGTFNCSMAAQKVMKKNGGGVILNISTTYAWTGSGYVVPSACAKAGVLAMTRSPVSYTHLTLPTKA